MKKLYIILAVFVLVGIGTSFTFARESADKTIEYSVEEVETTTTTIVETTTTTIDLSFLNTTTTVYVPPTTTTTAKPKPVAPAVSVNPSTEMERFLACVKQRESGGDYTARNPSSTAAGAYQFLDSTAKLVAGWMGRPDLSYDAATWSPADQEHGARVLYQKMGKSPWHYPASPC